MNNENNNNNNNNNNDYKVKYRQIYVHNQHFKEVFKFVKLNLIMNSHSKTKGMTLETTVSKQYND
jgi:hypothetical protein